jgi:hypothetical protein
MAPVRSPLGALDLIAKLIDLGDQRLDARAVQMLSTCLSSAKSSLASMFGESDKEQKGAQRLLSNDRVDPLLLREVAYASTLHRIADEGLTRVVCAYDPTLMDFSLQNWKQGRMPIGDGNGMGYEWLNAVLLDPLSKRLLGPLHQTLVSKSGPDDAHRLDYFHGITDKKLRKKLLLNPANQFLTIAGAVDARVPAGVEVIHVADREFDDGLTLRSRRKSVASHFVIRGNDNRVVQIHSPEWLPATLQKPDSNKQFEPTPEGLVNVHLKDLVRLLPCGHSMQLHLNSRGRVCVNSENASRTVDLSVGAIAIRLARMSQRGETFKLPEEPVWLNLVVVREDKPPAGKKPLQWLLLTDLPVATPDDLDLVIAVYGCRWRIEEFFRTVKDAMGIEKSELDDPSSTARLLFYTTLRAVFLDELRAKAEIPAGTPPTKEQRQDMVRGAERAILIETARRDHNKPPPKLTTRERARMTLGLIARRGRWTAKSKVSLGNYVLLSGLRIFLHDLSEQRYTWLIDDVG